jgi:hypothetical protein
MRGRVWEPVWSVPISVGKWKFTQSEVSFNLCAQYFFVSLFPFSFPLNYRTGPERTILWEGSRKRNEYAACMPYACKCNAWYSPTTFVGRCCLEKSQNNSWYLAVVRFWGQAQLWFDFEPNYRAGYSYRHRPSN